MQTLDRKSKGRVVVPNSYPIPSITFIVVRIVRIINQQKEFNKKNMPIVSHTLMNAARALWEWGARVGPKLLRDIGLDTMISGLDETMADSDAAPQLFIRADCWNLVKDLDAEGGHAGSPVSGPLLSGEGGGPGGGGVPTQIAVVSQGVSVTAVADAAVPLPVSGPAVSSTAPGFTSAAEAERMQAQIAHRRLEALMNHKVGSNNILCRRSSDRK